MARHSNTTLQAISDRLEVLEDWIGQLPRARTRAPEPVRVRVATSTPVTVGVLVGQGPEGLAFDVKQLALGEVAIVDGANPGVKVLLSGGLLETVE